MWEWLGSNAVGLIQIVIAVVALVLAYVVYKKVLKQIEISNEQTKISLEQERKGNEQRALDLKIKILDEIFKSLEMGRGLEVGLKDLTFECELLKRDLESEKNRDNRNSIESFEKLITGSQNSMEQIRSNNNNLVDLIRDGAKTDILELEHLNHTLTQAMLLREMDIKTHADQKIMRIDIKKYRSTMSN